MIEIIVAFIAGLGIGSFLNVCVYRLPRDLSVAKPARSFCPECEKTIAWYDNIPLLSFLILRGRCRQCSARISWRYPILELATGIVFLLCVSQFGVTATAAKYAIFVLVSNMLLLLLWLRGPFKTRRVVGYTVGVAGYFCTVFSLRLQSVNAVDLGRDATDIHL